jgi:hypothetical protein
VVKVIFIIYAKLVNHPPHKFAKKTETLYLTDTRWARRIAKAQFPPASPSSLDSYPIYSRVS